MVDLSKINEINDEEQLQKLLSSTEDFDERKIIRKRLLDVKAEKSKERELALREFEKRRDDDILERKRQREEDKRLEMQRLDDLAKSGSTGSRINNDLSKQREESIKEKARLADEEKKKEIQKFEQMAKNNSSAHERNDQTVQDNLKQKAAWATEDKQTNLKNLEKLSISSKTVASATGRAPAKQTGAKAAFAMFKSKDVEAGGKGKADGASSTGTSKATSAPTNPNSIKDNLLKWCQIKTQGYPNVSIDNFSSSWSDGMAFCALIHQHVPDAFDFNKLNPKNKRENFDLAFRVAEEKSDIAPLLETDDMIMMGNKPDWKCVFTYVQSFYRKFELEPKARAAREAQQAASN